MAKKKKNIVIVDEELTPTVLADLNKRKGSMIPLILIVIFFGAVIFYLPEISDFVNKYFSSNPSYVPAEKEETNNKHPEEETIEVVKYNIEPDLVIPGNNFELNNFIINEGKLTFNINNTGDTNLDFNNYKYYIGIYNSENTLLQRIKIEDISIPSGNMNVSYDLASANVAYFTFMEIKEEDYTVYDATDNYENGTGDLTCIKGNETVKYNFIDNLVYSITDTYNVSVTDPGYATYYANYQALAATYNTRSGVKSAVNVNDNEMNFTTEIDLNSYNNEAIGKIIYPKGTQAKVIYFELLARGYSCLE